MSAAGRTAAATFTRPGDALYWSEPLRAGADVAAFWAALPRLLAGTRGDGHAVLVIPGLLADDMSTTGLRTVLRARGYTARPWGLGPNVGPTSRVVDGAFGTLERLHRRHGPVSVIGWSLGGFFARQLARSRPDLVRQVITLGTPLQMRLSDDPGTSRAGWIFEQLRPWHTPFFDQVPREEDLPPMPVPSTAVYSRRDGIVPWDACLAVEGPFSENIEVEASHAGLGFHPPTLAVVLDRLGQPSGEWRPWKAPQAA